MDTIDNGPGSVVLSPADRDAAVAAVKARLGVTLASDDALVAAFAETALGLAEQFTGRVLIARAMTVRVAACGMWQRLPAAPVRAIGAVAAIGSDGTATSLPPERFAVDIDAGGRGWVRASGEADARVAVTFTAGESATWDALPAGLREGVCVLATHLHRDRGGDAPPPAAVTALWRPFRAIALAEARRA